MVIVHPDRVHAPVMAMQYLLLRPLAKQGVHCRAKTTAILACAVSRVITATAPQQRAAQAVERYEGD